MDGLKYFSTRGGDERLSFEEAVLTGLAPNGGLYIPTHIPSLPSDWQTAWAPLSFSELSHRILSLFIPPSSIPSADLKDIIDRSYATFRHAGTTPLKCVAEREYVLELWHGPTFAFKDVALQFLGNVFEYCLKRRNEGKTGKERSKLTVVGATSGDTGSAAIYGLRNKTDIQIFILYPYGRVSPIQEAQMATVEDDNVHCVAVDGTFDDCQDIVKTLFSDAEFNATHHLGAINSINWARILAQIVYYFHAYLHLPADVRSEGTPVQFAVPTGNFGDVLAGFYAKRLGLPMGKLVVATNENDILQRFWKTGIYEKADSSKAAAVSSETAPEVEVAAGSSDGKQAQAAGAVKETLSPAMDILVSSNFERLLWYLAYDTQLPSGGAPGASVGNVQDVRPVEDAGDAGSAGERVRRAQACVQGWMNELKSKGRVDLSSVLDKAKVDFVAERVSDQETVEQIRRYYTAKEPYVVDPHTAVGLAATERVIKTASSATTFITLATAHPAKFDSAVRSALPQEKFPDFDFRQQVMPEELRALEGKEKRVTRVQGEQGVRDFIVKVADETAAAAVDKLGSM